MVPTRILSRKSSLAGALTLLFATGCAHGPAPTSYREPASRAPASDLSLDTTLFRDFLHVDTRGKKIKRTMKTKFWTNMDPGYLHEGAERALQGAIMKALTDEEDPSMGFAKKLQSGLMENVLKEFVQTLRIYKIVNKTLQFDVYFLPSLDNPADFSPELANNGLIRLGNTGQLANELEALDHWKLTSAFSSFAQNTRDIAPPDATGHRAIGNVLTFYLKILDMNWDPSHPIPHPKQNAVKGFIRLRRYFTGSAPGWLPPVKCGDGIILKDLVPEGEQEEHWTTVDAIYSFNLASFLPKPDRIEIYPGRLMATNQGSGDLLPRGSDYVGKTLTSGDFELTLQKKGESPISLRPKKLTFSFQGELQENASEIKVAENFDVNEQTWVTPKITGLHLDSCAPEIKRRLNWSRFFSAWSRKGGAQ